MAFDEKGKKWQVLYLYTYRPVNVKIWWIAKLKMILRGWPKVNPSIKAKRMNFNKQIQRIVHGPPCSNKYDLEKGQRSRSWHRAYWKGLSQGSCIPNINALSLILQKIWARLKFLWQTEGRMSFNVGLSPLSVKFGDKNVLMLDLVQGCDVGY